jgi:spore maturation protein CgeB
MKIIVIGQFDLEVYAKAYYSAFKELGHEVEAIDYYSFWLKGKSKFCQIYNRIQKRYYIGHSMFLYNMAIKKKVKEMKPDLVFIYRGLNVFPSTVRKIRKQTMVFSYNNDDPMSGLPSKTFYDKYLHYLKYCDMNYVYRKKNIDDLAKMGITNTAILLPNYLKKWNFHIDCVKDIPIVFLGHYEPDGRDKMIERLMDEGLPISLYGDYVWKEDCPIYDKLKSIMHPLAIGEKYNEIINRSQIILVFLSKRNADTYTRRCFEIPATKNLMLCEYTDDMNAMFPENKAAVYFRNDDELVEKCTYLLANPKEIERIAENGYKRLHEIGGSEIDRANEILQAYNKIKASKETLINK